MGAVPFEQVVGKALRVLRPKHVVVQTHTDCAWLRLVQAGDMSLAADETRSILREDLDGADLSSPMSFRRLAERIGRHIKETYKDVETVACSSIDTQ